MKSRVYLVLASLLLSLSAVADEGMWMVGNLNDSTVALMKRLGLEIDPGRLYNPRSPSLTDAVVSFGGFCSGVVVSADGLVFTNHHCGLDAVQQHSEPGRDYLTNGFVARARDEELPNPELFVRFLVRQENVTRRILDQTRTLLSEEEREAVVDSMRVVIENEVSAADSALIGRVDAYYGGNEFWLSVYIDYTDVRLVFAPPSSIGKFGWDTDNWEWPRHTGDFSVFRVYADKNNRPAAYSPDNVPYHPRYVAPISMAGYREGSFSLTIGYPGQTDRYLSSFGIEETMRATNQAMIDLRGIKQAIWQQAMNQSDSIRIRYTSKYASSSNYWKNSIRANEAIERLRVLPRKRQLEATLQRWIERNTPEHDRLRDLLDRLKRAYDNRAADVRAMAYLYEAFLNGPELMQQTYAILNLDVDENDEQLVSRIRALSRAYADLDAGVDKQVMAAMLRAYRQQVEPRYLPDFYARIDTVFGGSEQRFVDDLYRRTDLITTSGLKRVLSNDSTYQLGYDAAVEMCLDLLATTYQTAGRMQGYSLTIEQGERQFNEAVRRMYASRDFYSDANSTLRLSFGTVRGYSPKDGIDYLYYTTSSGVLEKARRFAHDPQFYLQPSVRQLLEQKNFGRFADEKGDLRVCFLTDNDITGGNSGSAVFNSKGELIGLAFDGNSEAMSSDFQYEPALQRCIGVDIRYVLFVMDKLGNARHLIDELQLR